MSAPASGRARRKTQTPVHDPVPAGSMVGPVLLPAGVDQQVRWRPGERLERLFEERCDLLRHRGLGRKAAVETADLSLTYDELDRRANQLARYLAGRGARPGDRIALLLDQPLRSYISILAVLKLGAAFVPLDAGFPPDRLGYIINDAGAQFVLTLSHLRPLIPEGPAALVCVDDEDDAVAAEDPDRLRTDFPDGTADLAYIIYTSGSTGRPKGVAVDHPSICNFVRVAAETYGYRETDRVYQGMTIAFDFSVEEIWVPWMAGATLVPKPGGRGLLGMELGQFLREQHITAMCCVPTLLATLDEELPELRFLLVSGEACPRDLVRRWHRPGRRFLDVYGPTEATVTATWDVVHPDKPVTLGVPLPTYSIVVLHPDRPEVMPPGEAGEIGIAGIGLARGYVNRDDLTAKAFIEDFLELENNPSGRIYRTGDLGRITPEGTIEYHGRIDTQVKIRGYRIELSEIESVILQAPGVAQAVVDIYRPDPDVVELVGYYSLRPGTDLDNRALHQQLRSRLPAYMVPAYLERLDEVPTMPSGKVDRKNLPEPAQRLSLLDEGAYQAPETPAEAALAAELAPVLGADRVSVTAHFFDDLGLNSLLLANFSSRVRKNTDLPSLAIQDLYERPSIRDLAAGLPPADAASPAVDAGAWIPLGQATRPPAHASSTEYVFCGVLQVLVFLVYTYLTAELLLAGFTWAAAGNSLLEIWLRSVGFGWALFVVLSIVPILVKWVLIGRWKEQEIKIWSLSYFRFWFVKTVVNTNPLRMFAGTPLFSFYLRLLGAKVGRHVTYLSTTVPECTDLFTIGDGTIVRKDTDIHCYRSHAGRLFTGPVTLGRNVLIGEQSVVDIHTSMGDNTQLGHSSGLLSYQYVPDGEHWHGSPARRTDTNYDVVPPQVCGTRRRAVYSFWLLVNRFILVVPLGIAGIAAFLPDYLELGHLDHARTNFYLDMVFLSLMLYLGGLILGLAFIVTIPRLINLFLTPGKVYPLFGIRYVIHRTVMRMTNSRVYLALTGDSSLIVHYLRILGYKQPGLVQTGSNFGPELKHENPYLTVVGSGTMVSDGLSIMNADYSSTSFRVAKTTIGQRNFFGNGIAYPAGAATGDNVLFGTKTLVPIDGPVRENIGLLGSPPFEIPRTVLRDSEIALRSDEELKERLPAKNRHNAVTLALYMAVSWFRIFVGTLAASVSAATFEVLGAVAILVPTLFFVFFNLSLSIFLERAVTGFKPLQPTLCSIYDIRFWRHERFWRFIGSAASMFNGTPMKGFFWRLEGVKAGKYIFDDGMSVPEKTLVTIGDYATLNPGSVIQCHSMEDGAFKLGATTLGSDVTVGVGGFVHYGVTMQDGSVLDADAFLMKGSEVPAGGRYSGNPAREIEVPAAADVS